MQPFQIEQHIYDEPMRIDTRHKGPWAIVESDLNESGNLYDVLLMKFVSILAAHVLAHVKGAKESDPVKFRKSYPGLKGWRAVMDLEHNGILYRHFNGRIHTKRVGN